MSASGTINPWHLASCLSCESSVSIRGHEFGRVHKLRGRTKREHTIELCRHGIFQLLQILVEWLFVTRQGDNASVLPLQKRSTWNTIENQAFGGQWHFGLLQFAYACIYMYIYIYIYIYRERERERRGAVDVYASEAFLKKSSHISRQVFSNKFLYQTMRIYVNVIKFHISGCFKCS
jgi:hypothetical protein